MLHFSSQIHRAASISVCIALLCLGSVTLSAQTAPTEPKVDDAAEKAELAVALTPADKKFIKDAGEALFLELTIAEIALRRNRPVGASVDAARKAGNLIHDDLKKVWEDFAGFARAKGEKVRDELSGVEKREVERLRSVEVDKFNKEVVESLGKQTKRLVQLFASKSFQHPTLKRLTERHLPTLTKQANELPQAVK